MVHLLHRINPYCTVFGSHLPHRMYPYYTVFRSHLLHIINPQLHWFWFNFTLYYLHLASDYTISDYTVFQKYSIQCIPGSCCTMFRKVEKKMILLYFEYPRPVYCKRFHFGESDNYGLFGKIWSFGHTVFRDIMSCLLRSMGSEFNFPISFPKIISKNLIDFH